MVRGGRIGFMARQHMLSALVETYVCVFAPVAGALERFVVMAVASKCPSVWKAGLPPSTGAARNPMQRLVISFRIVLEEQLPVGLDLRLMKMKHLESFGWCVLLQHRSYFSQKFPQRFGLVAQADKNHPR